MSQENQSQTQEERIAIITGVYNRKISRIYHILFPLTLVVGIAAGLGTLFYSINHLQKAPFVARQHAKASETRDAPKHSIAHFQRDTLSYRPTSLDSSLAYIFDSKHRSLGDLEKATSLVGKDVSTMENDVSFKAWKLYDPEKQWSWIFGKTLLVAISTCVSMVGLEYWKEKRYEKERDEKLKRIGAE